MRDTRIDEMHAEVGTTARHTSARTYETAVAAQANFQGKQGPDFVLHESRRGQTRTAPYLDLRPHHLPIIPVVTMTNRTIAPVCVQLSLVALFCLVPALSRTAYGQALQPRYGVGFNVLATTSDGVGLGLHGRAAIPANANLSIGLDLGVTGFIFSGRDNANYAFDPQLSLIVTLPGGERAAYVMGGVGAYIPTSDSEGGPTVHFGIGRAQLIGETSVYYEIDPAIVIEKDDVQFNLPIRFGIIF